jgi:MFS family permease
VPQRASTLAPFQHRTFRILWTATQASNLGGLIQGVGAGWMMTMIAQSEGMVALVQGATTLPIMLFSLASGALADNFDRRRVMLAAQGLMMIASCLLVLFAFQDWLTPWLLLGFTFAIGCGTALNNPSWQASVGDLVPRDDLPGAVTLNSMGFNLMRSIGPALGGFIVAVAGAATAFAVNAASYIPLIAALVWWKPEPTQNKLPREQFGSAVWAGLRYISMSPNLITVLFRAMLFGCAAIAVLALLPLVASNLLKGGALSYGVLLGCFGLGAIIGGFLNARVRELMSNETIVRVASVGFAVSCILLAVTSSAWLSGLLLLPTGACWVLALSLFNVTVQLSTPRWVVGRALSLYQTATFGGMAAGSWLWGEVAEAQGTPGALMAAGALLVVTALVGLRYRLPEFSSLNLAPLDQFSEPQLMLDLKARSGPIMIMVDFRIAQEDVPAFLAAMADRRRIRIRDGARQWVLLRDLENPEIWTESYHVATWVEYVRHNQRRTRADADVTERLMKLHRGPERPRVHRMIERQTVPLQDDTPLKGNPEVP